MLEKIYRQGIEDGMDDAQQHKDTPFDCRVKISAM
jgi:hypothetical protein